MTQESSSQKQKLLRLYIATSGVFFLALAALWQSASFLPHSKMIRRFFLDENNLLEVLALGFLFSGLLLAIAALIRARRSQAYSPLWWLFPLGIFLLICDETSFGRVYYPWYAPVPICGMKFDALHDGLAVIPHCLPQLGISKTAFVLAAGFLLLFMLALIGSLVRKKKAALLGSFQQAPVWLYLGIAFILFWIGGGLEFVVEIDSLGIEKDGFLVFLEEVFESLAEYTVLFAAIVFWRTPPRG